MTYVTASSCRRLRRTAPSSVPVTESFAGASNEGVPRKFGALNSDNVQAEVHDGPWAAGSRLYPAGRGNAEDKEGRQTI